MIMTDALSHLVRGLDKGSLIIQRFIDDYYSSMESGEDNDSLDHYCHSFIRQMGIALIVPAMLSRKVSTDRSFALAIQSAYGSFGVAWRLLDDINDIEKDMLIASHSSVYVALPEDLKFLWDNLPESSDATRSSFRRKILDHIQRKNIARHIEDRICSELESSVRICEHYNMQGLANEFRCLVKPIKSALSAQSRRF